jgi:hypothetical protein
MLLLKISQLTRLLLLLVIAFLFVYIQATGTATTNSNRNSELISYYYNVYENNKCRESRPAEESFLAAHIIVTGTVRKIERNYSQATYAASVQIHRILKGYELVYDLLNINTAAAAEASSSSNSNLFHLAEKRDKLLAKRTSKFASINGNFMLVRNFGSAAFCDSHVKPNDVRIFLLKVNSRKEIYLASSLIRVFLADGIKSSLGKNEKLKEFMKCRLRYNFSFKISSIRLNNAAAYNKKLN